MPAPKTNIRLIRDVRSIAGVAARRSTAVAVQSALAKNRNRTGIAGAVGTGSQPVDTGQGVGLVPPFTFVSRTYFIEDVTDDAGDTFQQEVDLFISYTDANGLAFDLPSGFVAPGGTTILIRRNAYAWYLQKVSVACVTHSWLSQD